MRPRLVSWNLSKLRDSLQHHERPRFSLAYHTTIHDGISNRGRRVRSRRDYCSLSCRIDEEENDRGPTGRATLFVQNHANIGVLVFILKYNVTISHFAYFHAPQTAHHCRGSIGDNKGLQEHGGIAQALFDLLDSLMKLDFRIVWSQVTNPLRVHKDDTLLTI